MTARIGRFFFRTRNALFPLAMVLIVVVFPPRAFGELSTDVLAAFGAAAAVAGQAIRVVTVGLDYVKRGGKGKRIYAARLVTGGIYAHTRNPMYLGNLLVVWGLLLAAGNPWAIVIGGAFFTFAYVSIVAAEEEYLTNEFGDSYRAYCSQTRRWFPRPWHLIGTLRAYRFDWPAVVVKEYGTIASTFGLLTALAAWKAARSGLLERLEPILIATAIVLIVLYAIARYLKKRRGWLARGSIMSVQALKERRKRLDRIDADILGLLNRRATEVSAIQAWKRQEEVAQVDPQRMESIILRLQELNPGPLSDEQVRRLFAGILFHFSYEHGSDAERSDASTNEPKQQAVVAATTTQGDPA